MFKRLFSVFLILLFVVSAGTVALPTDALAVEQVQIRIDWTDTNLDEDGYRYELKDNSDPMNPWVLRADNIAPTVLFAEDIVDVGKEWCVRITAFRTVDGAEAVSMEQCLTTVTELAPLNPPDPVTVNQPGAPA